MKEEHKNLQAEFKAEGKRQQDEMEAMKEEIKTLRKLIEVHMTVVPVEFALEMPSQYIADNKWTSKHFYSHCGGYKLQLRFHNIKEQGNYCIQCYITQGEFDHLLKWPFKAVIVILLINRQNECISKLQIHVGYGNPIINGKTYLCGTHYVHHGKDEPIHFSALLKLNNL